MDFYHIAVYLYQARSGAVEIRVKNLLSFLNETVFSFDADNSKRIGSYLVVEPTPGICLLQLSFAGK